MAARRICSTLLMLLLFFHVARGIEDDAGLKRPVREESVHVDADETVGDVGTSAEAGKHQEKEEVDNLSQHTRDPGWWVYEIDTDGDGKVTRVEIVEWIMRNEDKGNSKEIDLQWSIYDSDHSGRVSWEEYQTVFLKKSGVSLEDLEDETMQKMYTESEKGRFTYADGDKDGELDKQELKAILFPHHHDHMVDHLVQEMLSEIDQDNDGFIQPLEYKRVYLNMFGGTVNEVGDESDLDEETQDRVRREMERFTSELDVNKDGHLDKDELEPMVARRRRTSATAEADRIFKQSDKNKDGELTHDEVLQGYDHFMSDYYVDNDDDDDMVDEWHDEL